jgi:hypothetical protein
MQALGCTPRPPQMVYQGVELRTSVTMHADIGKAVFVLLYRTFEIGQFTLMVC